MIKLSTVYIDKPTKSDTDVTVKMTLRADKREKKRVFMEERDVSGCKKRW